MRNVKFTRIDGTTRDYRANMSHYELGISHNKPPRILKVNVGGVVRKFQRFGGFTPETVMYRADIEGAYFLIEAISLPACEDVGGDCFEENEWLEYCELARKA